MKKIHLLILPFVFLFVNACTITQEAHSNIQQAIPIVSSKDVSKLTPSEVVILYFQAWNDEQYDIMYSLISDGFKQIEPTAKTFDDFKANMEKFYDTALGLGVLEAKESYQNDKEAGVDYKIEITNKDNTKKEFSSTYTLKARVNGWKLIHPYGENIDTT
ncbi:hypothetical protein HYX03_03695 [Candidatus Woesearchaeota archaeon]|nr:hypothetical protein [Candidatus Woesearchaeota archaeon]